MHILQTKDSITQLCRSDSRVTLLSCHILNLPLRNHITVSQPKAGVSLSRALRASGCVHAYMSVAGARILSILEGYVLRGPVTRLDIIMRWQAFKRCDPVKGAHWGQALKGIVGTQTLVLVFVCFTVIMNYIVWVHHSLLA